MDAHWGDVISFDELNLRADEEVLFIGRSCSQPIVEARRW
jgi:hypothetical protein